MKEKYYPAEEQGIIEEKHGEEEALEIDLGEKEEDIYDETGREMLLEEDEIAPDEEGFMEGYEEEGSAVCKNCGDELNKESQIIERQINNKIVRFCSEKCLKEFLKRNK